MSFCCVICDYLLYSIIYNNSSGGNCGGDGGRSSSSRNQKQRNITKDLKRRDYLQTGHWRDSKPGQGQVGLKMICFNFSKKLMEEKKEKIHVSEPSYRKC